MQLYENGVAGIHIMGTNNFTFDATIGEESTVGEGNVGNLDGQQPIDVIIESSTLVTFNDLRVQSSNGKSVCSAPVKKTCLVRADDCYLGERGVRLQRVAMQGRVRICVLCVEASIVIVARVVILETTVVGDISVNVYHVLR